MAKRSMVLFGLSGPVTQPTTRVPGGAVDTAAAGAGAGCAATGAGAAGATGCGTGSTAACLLVCAAVPDWVPSAWASSWPRFGGGAASLAPTGRCPIGRVNGAILPGVGIWTSWPGDGWACAAAPLHPSAAAGGAARPAHSTGIRAHAIHDEALPGLGDTTHLPFTSDSGGCPV